MKHEIQKELSSAAEMVYLHFLFQEVIQLKNYSERLLDHRIVYLLHW